MPLLPIWKVRIVCALCRGRLHIAACIVYFRFSSVRSRFHRIVLEALLRCCLILAYLSSLQPMIPPDWLNVLIYFFPWLIGGRSEGLVCVCVFSSHSFWTSSSLDVPAGITQTGGRSHRISHPPSFWGACLNLLARNIQPFFSLVDREVEFCVLTI